MSELAVIQIQSLVRRSLSREACYQRIIKRWERIYDPKHQLYYYYNVVDDVAQWKKPSILLWRDIEKLAPTYTKAQAAILIQSASRRLIDRRIGRRLMAENIGKYYDIDSAAYYYIFSITGNSTWEKPSLLGPYDVKANQLVFIGTHDAPLDIEKGESEAEDDKSADVPLDNDSESEIDDLISERAEDTVLGREWPRSFVQRLVDRAEDDPDGATELTLTGIGLKRLTFRIFAIESLTKLDISKNKLLKIPREIGSASSLRLLDLSENFLKRLPTELEDLHALETLRAARNQIQSFSPRIYTGLSETLQELDLEHNCFSELPYVVGDVDLLRETKIWEVGIGMLSQLRILNLRSNKINSWPLQIDKLKLLETLDISCNMLETITSSGEKGQEVDWAALVHLRNLYISKNRIRVLPEAMATLPCLQIFELYDNQLNVLPSTFATAAFKKTLKEFSFGNNQVSAFSISAFPNLNNLSARANQLAEIDYNEKAKVRALASLDLNQNSLSKLPSALSKVSSLTSLKCRQNGISTLPKGFGALVRLKVLDFSRNRFKTIDGRPFVSLISLIELDLSYNALKELPKQFSNLKALQILNLTGNKLSKLPNGLTTSATSLTELYLAKNEFSTLSNDMSTMIHLKTLSLDHNKFEMLPAQIASLPKMTKLQFNYNPIVRHIIDILQPFHAYTTRAPHTCVSYTTANKNIDLNLASSEVRLNQQRFVLRQKASLGAERIESAEYDNAIEPLAAAAKICNEIILTNGFNDEASHHFLLGAALVARARVQLERRRAHAKEISATGTLSLSDDENWQRPRILKKDQVWEAEKLRTLRQSLHAFDQALSIMHASKSQLPYPEIYYCRGLALYYLNRYQDVLPNVTTFLSMRSEHIPGWILQVQARCALGQYSQARRDCNRVHRLATKSDVSPHQLEEKFNFTAIENLVADGLNALHAAGCDDCELERVFEVTSEGVLLRRKAELKALETNGRSVQRARRGRVEQTESKRIKALLLKQAQNAEDRQHCQVLADRVRAELAWRAARYKLEFAAERLKHKAEKEARLKAEQAEAKRKLEREEKARQVKELNLMKKEDTFSALAFSSAAANENATKILTQDEIEENDLDQLRNARKRGRRRWGR